MVEEIKSAPTAKVTVSVPAAPAPAVYYGFNDKIPSNWDLKADENGNVEGTNLSTGRQFKGTIAEFNEMLRS